MMNSVHRELFEEGLEVEHEKIVKFGCWKEVLKTDMKPGDKKIDSTWSSRFKPSGGLPRCRVTARGFR